MNDKIILEKKNPLSPGFDQEEQATYWQQMQNSGISSDEAGSPFIWTENVTPQGVFINNIISPFLDGFLNIILQQLWKNYLEKHFEKLKDFNKLKDTLSSNKHSVSEKTELLLSHLNGYPLVSHHSQQLLQLLQTLKALSELRNQSASQQFEGIFTTAKALLSPQGAAQYLFGHETARQWLQQLTRLQQQIELFRQLVATPPGSPEAFFQLTLEKALLPYQIDKLLREGEEFYNRIKNGVTQFQEGVETAQAFLSSWDKASSVTAKLATLFTLLMNRSLPPFVINIFEQAMPETAKAFRIVSMISNNMPQSSNNNWLSLLETSQYFSSPAFRQQLNAQPSSRLSEITLHISSELSSYLTSTLPVARLMSKTLQGNMEWNTFFREALEILGWQNSAMYLAKQTALNAVSYYLPNAQALYTLMNEILSSEFVAQLPQMSWLDIPIRLLDEIKKQVENPSPPLKKLLSPGVLKLLDGIAILKELITGHEDWLVVMLRFIRVAAAADNPLVILAERLSKFGLIWLMWRAENESEQLVIQQRLARMQRLFPEPELQLIYDMINWLPLLQRVKNALSVLPEYQENDTLVSWLQKVLNALYQNGSGPISPLVASLRKEFETKLTYWIGSASQPVIQAIDSYIQTELGEPEITAASASAGDVVFKLLTRLQSLEKQPADEEWPSPNGTFNSITQQPVADPLLPSFNATSGGAELPSFSSSNADVTNQPVIGTSSPQVNMASGSEVTASGDATENISITPSKVAIVGTTLLASLGIGGMVLLNRNLHPKSAVKAPVNSGHPHSRVLREVNDPVSTELSIEDRLNEEIAALRIRQQISMGISLSSLVTSILLMGSAAYGHWQNRQPSLQPETDPGPERKPLLSNSTGTTVSANKPARKPAIFSNINEYSNHSNLFESGVYSSLSAPTINARRLPSRLGNNFTLPGIHGRKEEAQPLHKTANSKVMQRAARNPEPQAAIRQDNWLQRNEKNLWWAGALMLLPAAGSGAYWWKISRDIKEREHKKKVAEINSRIKQMKDNSGKAYSDILLSEILWQLKIIRREHEWKNKNIHDQGKEAIRRLIDFEKQKTKYASGNAFSSLIRQGAQPAATNTNIQGSTKFIVGNNSISPADISFTFMTSRIKRSIHHTTRDILSTVGDAFSAADVTAIIREFGYTPQTIDALEESNVVQQAETEAENDAETYHSQYFSIPFIDYSKDSLLFSITDNDHKVIDSLLVDAPRHPQSGSSDSFKRFKDSLEESSINEYANIEIDTENSVKPDCFTIKLTAKNTSSWVSINVIPDDVYSGKSYGPKKLLGSEPDNALIEWGIFSDIFPRENYQELIRSNGSILIAVRTGTKLDPIESRIIFMPREKMDAVTWSTNLIELINEKMKYIEFTLGGNILNLWESTVFLKYSGSKTNRVTVLIEYIPEDIAKKIYFNSMHYPSLLNDLLFNKSNNKNNIYRRYRDIYDEEFINKEPDDKLHLVTKQQNIPYDGRADAWDRPFSSSYKSPANTTVRGWENNLELLFESYVNNARSLAEEILRSELGGIKDENGKNNFIDNKYTVFFSYRDKYERTRLPDSINTAIDAGSKILTTGGFEGVAELMIDERSRFNEFNLVESGKKAAPDKKFLKTYTGLELLTGKHFKDRYKENSSNDWSPYYNYPNKEANRKIAGILDTHKDKQNSIIDKVQEHIVSNDRLQLHLSNIAVKNINSLRKHDFKNEIVQKAINDFFNNKIQAEIPSLSVFSSEHKVDQTIPLRDMISLPVAHQYYSYAIIDVSNKKFILEPKIPAIYNPGRAPRFDNDKENLDIILPKTGLYYRNLIVSEEAKLRKLHNKHTGVISFRTNIKPRGNTHYYKSPFTHSDQAAPIYYDKSDVQTERPGNAVAQAILKRDNDTLLADIDNLYYTSTEMLMADISEAIAATGMVWTLATAGIGLIVALPATAAFIALDITLGLLSSVIKHFNADDIEEELSANSEILWNSLFAFIGNFSSAVDLVKAVKMRFTNKFFYDSNSGKLYKTEKRFNTGKNKPTPTDIEAPNNIRYDAEQGKIYEDNYGSHQEVPGVIYDKDTKRIIANKDTDMRTGEIVDVKNKNTATVSGSPETNVDLAENKIISKIQKLESKVMGNIEHNRAIDKIYEKTINPPKTGRKDYAYIESGIRSDIWGTSDYLENLNNFSIMKSDKLQWMLKKWGGVGLESIEAAEKVALFPLLEKLEQFEKKSLPKRIAVNKTLSDFQAPKIAGGASQPLTQMIADLESLHLDVSNYIANSKSWSNPRSHVLMAWQVQLELALDNLNLIKANLEKVIAVLNRFDDVDKIIDGLVSSGIIRRAEIDLPAMRQEIIRLKNKFDSTTVSVDSFWDEIFTFNTLGWKGTISGTINSFEAGTGHFRNYDPRESDEQQ